VRRVFFPDQGAIVETFSFSETRLTWHIERKMEYHLRDDKDNALQLAPLISSSARNRSGFISRRYV